MRGNNGSNQALPQTRDVSSNKRRGGDGGDSRVATMAVVEEDGGGGRQQQWRMTKVVDENSTQDQAADYKGEGQERAARDGGDSGVAMMATAVEDGGGRRQQ
jgi:hypothetical protein